MGHPGHDGRLLLTVTFHPLVDEAVQQRSAMVAEGGTAVAVNLKLVLASGILQKHEKERNHLQLHYYRCCRDDVCLQAKPAGQNFFGGG